MNKKRLSVVMAGAMLATSVAPVLAAETTGTEIAYDQLATFKSDLLAKMANKDNKISNFAIFKTAGFVSSDIATELSGNATGEFSSKLGVKITGKDGVVKLDTTYTTDAGKLETALDNLAAGDKVEVYERETTDFKGQLIPGTGLKVTVKPDKYTVDDFTNNIDTVLKGEIAPAGSEMVDENNANVESTAAISANDKKDTLTVLTKKLINPVGADNTVANRYALTYKVDEEKIDGKLPLDEKGNLLDYTDETSTQSLASFDKLAQWQASTEAADKGAKLVETYTIGEKPADASKETVKASDLYDGIALTAKGTEIVVDLTNAKKAHDAEGETGEAPLVKITSVTPGSGLDANGLARFQIAYYKNGKLAGTDSAATDTVTNAEKVITVVSSNREEIVSLYNLIKSGTFKVGVVAGQNRYETAVNVAKQIGVSKLDKANNGTSNGNNIVLVNGESLVDGLAAAPLAAELGCYQVTDGAKSAPLLLSQTDKLPTATKEYLETLVADFTTAEKRAVKVHLVGGTSVLSSELVKELREIGFSVVRHGGENREATSVAVAKELTNATNKAFVVGGNGEADAMAISAVAAKDKTPIIVSKVNGLSSSATDYLREKSVNDITIIGGESVVSKDEESKIDKAIPGVKTMRIAGKNRFETNNAIIEEFYKGNAEGVVVVKDGVANKDQLVDALSAANYAAANNAPIVLATSGITDAQKSTLLKAKKSTGFDLLAQVGIGAEGTVLETLAGLLDISNK